MSAFVRAAIVALSVLVIGCDTSTDLPTSELCTWAQDAGNCWRVLVREVEECLAAEGDASSTPVLDALTDDVDGTSPLDGPCDGGAAPGCQADANVDGDANGDGVADGDAELASDGAVLAQGDAPSSSEFDAAFEGDAAPGILEGDGGTTCTYADRSRTIVSESGLLPADASVQGVTTRSFRVESRGRTCLTLSQSHQGDDHQLHVTSPTRTVDVATVGGRIGVTCSDGTSLSGDRGAVQRCLDLSGGHPGIAVQESQTGVWLSLLGMRDAVYWCGFR